MLFEFGKLTICLIFSWRKLIKAMCVLYYISGWRKLQEFESPNNQLEDNELRILKLKQKG